jgi:8-oxo-dGTP pyrophosphatase MutT (NUDIX family)
MENILKKQLLRFSKLSHLNKSVYAEFLRRFSKGRLFRHNNKKSHFCVFFLPVDKSLKYCYLGWHKKADGWIPPGGHIDKDETPVNTVKREFQEELKFKLTCQKIIPFNLSVKNIKNPNNKCRYHWDLWFIVICTKTNFDFLKQEYWQAGWQDVNTARFVVKGKNYQNTIAKLPKFLKSL